MPATTIIPHTLTFDPFLAVLQKTGLLQGVDSAQLLAQMQQSRQSLIPALIQQQLAAKAIAEQLAEYLRLTFFDLSQLRPEAVIQDVIDEGFIRQYRILPLFIQDHQLYLAISEPAHLEHVGEVKFHTDLGVQPVVVEWDKLNRLVDTWLSAAHYRLLAQFALTDAAIAHDERIVAWVQQLLQDAAYKGASDIHLEPSKTAYRIRFRLDGILHKMAQLPLEVGQRINARLKVMAHLDLAERRLPQDGRFSLEIGSAEPKDCRISVCPTLFGEKTVVRILDAGKISLVMDDLGLEPGQKTLFSQAIHKPQGMVLVTGPTGSGKTVTLYTALNLLNSLEKNICTVEEPVEITLPGINQINVDTKIALTFAKVMRAFLRQDPDILMIGEIRDQETAETAIKAAQTGHLVLATLHTNSAVDTLTRLAMLGISAFNIAHCVQLIVAQRLVRKLCVKCKREQPPLVGQVETMPSFEAVGCDHCSKGYRGRAGVFECLTITAEIAAMIVAGRTSAEIMAVARSNGMLSLQAAALRKVQAGVTSYQELQRVIY